MTAKPATPLPWILLYSGGIAHEERSSHAAGYNMEDAAYIVEARALLARVEGADRG